MPRDHATVVVICTKYAQRLKLCVARVARDSYALETKEDLLVELEKKLDKTLRSSDLYEFTKFRFRFCRKL